MAFCYNVLVNSNPIKNMWTLIGLLIITGSFVLFFSSKTSVLVHQVMVANASIEVELAQTEAKRELGPSGHKPLADNEGMLFIFDQPKIYSFWMKDMLFSLDMVWVGSDFKIVDITHNAKLESYPATFSPKEPAIYVLEINTGVAEKNNWQIGDEVKFLQ